MNSLHKFGKVQVISNVGQWDLGGESIDSRTGLKSKEVESLHKSALEKHGYGEGTARVFHVFLEGILGHIGSRRRGRSRALGWGLGRLEGSPDPVEKIETWEHETMGFQVW